MSQASVELVREFFLANDFFVLKKEDLLLIKNPVGNRGQKPEKLLMGHKEVKTIAGNAAVKPVCWHTMTFTPGVLSKFPEIFDFSRIPRPFRETKAPQGTPTVAQNALSWPAIFFKGEPFKKILVIPALPASPELRAESMDIIRQKGIDHLMIFSSLIRGLIEKIDSRHLYLSPVNEILRVLKFYRLLASGEQELPFWK